jgi:hypothetical protein
LCRERSLLPESLERVIHVLGEIGLIAREQRQHELRGAVSRRDELNPFPDQVSLAAPHRLRGTLQCPLLGTGQVDRRLLHAIHGTICCHRPCGGRNRWGVQSALRGDVTSKPESVDVQRFREGLGRASVRQGSVDRSLRLLIRGVCRLVSWRVDASGFDDLPRGETGRAGAGCLVVAAPHRAWIDPFLLLAAWPSTAARLVWFGDGPTMSRSWWRRWLFPRLGMIPITPGSGGPRAYAALAAQVTDAGAALVIFPEKGPPSPPEETRTIAPGFAYLAIRAGARVIPVVLAGTHRIVRGSSFTVDALEAIDVGDADAQVFSQAGRRRAGELTERYRAMVAALLPSRSALADARRPEREHWRWLATLFH